MIRLIHSTDIIPQRKNAKILNFSIAYGKTAFGLAKDFKVSRKEAAETLDRWYQDRPEVKVWQERAIRTANLFGYTRTLMGRYRMLPDAMLSNKRAIGAKQARAHAERAAINTPIQVRLKYIECIFLNIAEYLNISEYH